MKPKFITGPRIIAVLAAIMLAGALWLATRDPALEVETATADIGPVTVTIDDLGETRIRDLYTLSAPVTGELLRVPLKPGAPVAEGALITRIRPMEPGPLDARVLAQTRATIDALEAQAAAAVARTREATAALILAERELTRTRALSERGFVTMAALDQAQAGRDRARQAQVAARAGATAARYNLASTRAGLILPGGPIRGHGVVTVTAPAAGTVLTVPQESMRVVTAGTPLVTIGDPANLEIVTDLLSADAVRVRPGASVSIEDWGGEHPLHGRVRLVEPYGALKISALGVEEQRVNVVIDFADPRTAWQRMGHGFRATVRITVDSAARILRVPISALFRSGNDWSVFTVDASQRARMKRVDVGLISDSAAEIRNGLVPGERIILHPGNGVSDGTRVSY